MKTRLAIASIVLGTSMPGILAQQGGAPGPARAANPPRLPLEQRITHDDPSRYRASTGVHGGPGRLNFFAMFGGDPIKIGDAVPIRVGETKGFENTGSAPLEFLVVGIARDITKKNDMLAPPPQRMGGPGRGRGRGQ